MKKLLHVVSYLFSGVIILLGTAFCVIEGRLLFSGDWLIYESAFHGCVQCFCRFLMAVFTLIIGALPFRNKFKQNPRISAFHRTGTLALVVMSMITCFFATNYVGEILLSISAIYFLLNLFQSQKGRQILSAFFLLNFHLSLYL